jgi:hypothetical protein
MKLLVDTDAFCKLGLANLFEETVSLLGAEQNECARLPALPHMLQRGRLFKRLGEENCLKLLPIANSIGSIPEPSEKWLQTLTPLDGMDPGEVQLYAVAADSDVLVLTDDKRSMKELKKLQGILQVLNGKLVVLELVLLALCRKLGVEEVRSRVSPVVFLDTMLSVCFSSGNNHVIECLESYHQTLAADLRPLVLWSPEKGAQ